MKIRIIRYKHGLKGRIVITSNTAMDSYKNKMDWEKDKTKNPSYDRHCDELIFNADELSYDYKNGVTMYYNCAMDIDENLYHDIIDIFGTQEKAIEWLKSY